MKSITSALIAGSVAGALAVVAVAALDGGTGPVQAVEADRVRTITAEGTGVVSGTPDLLTIEMGVRAQGTSAREALSTANDQARSLIGQLESSGVDEDDIATTGLSVFPRYSNDGERIVGYEAINLVSAKMRDIDRAGELIDTAAGAVGDAIVINGIQFSVEDTTELFAQARAQAVDRARRQAEQLAEAAGLELGVIHSVSEVAQGDVPLPTRLEAGGDAGGGVPLQPGSQQVHLTVTVVFEVA